MSSVGLATVTARQPFRAAAALVDDLIGPALEGIAVDTPRRANNTWIALLCLNAAVALLLIAAGHGAGRRGDSHASILFWSGVVLLVLPTASRALLPAV